MAERIGVYVCECGPNIKDAMHVNEIVEFARGLEDVVVSKPYNLLCSEDGKEFLKKEIKENNLSRVIIAACSAKEHENTFKKVLKGAGLNPFLLQIANIREQCAWVIKDKGKATEKAKSLIKSAIKRVLHHEPLEIKEIESCPDVLVVGAGITGISAALNLSQRNRRVYLVEKNPCIGGKIARYEEVFPNLECASCMLDPKMDEVLHNENIELFTSSEVEEVVGSYGNFTVKVKRNATYIENSCIGCGACFEVCPVSVKNEYNEGLPGQRKAVYIPYDGAQPYRAVIDKEHCLQLQGKECTACQKACPFGSVNYGDKDKAQELKVGAIVLATGFDLFDLKKAPQYGYGKVENVYTGFEFERLMSQTGPTKGKVLLKNGQPPKKIIFVHCAGSRTKKLDEHCSGVCCTYLLKFAHLAKKKAGGAVSVALAYSDFCLPGKDSQIFADKVLDEKGIELLHMQSPDSIEITENRDKIVVKYRDVNGRARKDTADMVVLGPAIEGSKGAKKIAEAFDITQGKAGFFAEEHSKLAPVSTTSEGIFIAGCAQGPMDIQASVVQGLAAAGRVLSRLVPGEKLTLEPMIAVIDEDLCSGCKTCIALCPYKAIIYEEKDKKAKINEALCRGCGVCVVACPSAGIKARHFTDKQIFAELKGLLK